MTGRLLSALGWLVRDTFRQARASGVLPLILLVTALSVFLCLTVQFGPGQATTSQDFRSRFSRKTEDVVQTARVLNIAETIGSGAVRSQGNWHFPSHLVGQSVLQEHVLASKGKKGPQEWTKTELLFGALRLDTPGNQQEAVRSLQIGLAGGVADAVGLILMLLWTAGLLPAFLDPSAVTVLLSKRIPRWVLLLGKFLGILLFVGVQAGLFVFLTWLALGLRTGAWDLRYFVAVPLLLLQFWIFFSFSAMLAVSTRSTVACAFGSVTFWLLCWGMNFGRHSVLTFAELQGMPVSFGNAVELGYWVLPKPLDLHVFLFKLLDAEHPFGFQFDVQLLTERGLFSPLRSTLASVGFGLGVLVVAAYDFLTVEY